MDPGWTCSVCNLASAESFCCCGNSETLLCRNCLVTHYTKFQKRLHQNLPLAAYGYHRTPGYFDRLNARMQAVETGKEALLQQMKLTDRCLQDINTKLNELYQRLWETGQKALEEVMLEQTKLQETVQRSIEEAERTIYEDNPVLAGTYTAALRVFTGNFQGNLFQYEVKVCDTVDSIFKVTHKTAADLNQLPEEKKLVPSPAVAEAEVPNQIWTCSNCGYNDNHDICCIKCRLKNPAIPSPPVQEQRGSNHPSLGRNPIIWTCTCGYAYNLATAEKCIKCGFLNPFIPPQPPLKKCVKCCTREVVFSTDMCLTCRNEVSAKNPPACTYWTCVYCHSEFNLVKKACWKCSRTQEEVYPELKKAPAHDLPQRPKWNCSRCGCTNESARMNCIRCYNAKRTVRCSTCRAEKISELSVCAHCGEGKNKAGEGGGPIRQSQNAQVYELLRGL